MTFTLGRWVLEAAGRELGLGDPRVQPTGAGEGKKWRERVQQVLKCASSTGRKVGQVKRQSRDGLSTLPKCGGECGITITDRKITRYVNEWLGPGSLHSEAEQVGSRDEEEKKGNKATKEGMRREQSLFFENVFPSSQYPCSMQVRAPQLAIKGP